MEEPERLYTVKEAAAVLRCSGRTIYREIERGRLEAKQGMGKTLITASALHTFIVLLDDAQ